MRGAGVAVESPSAADEEERRKSSAQDLHRGPGLLAGPLCGSRRAGEDIADPGVMALLALCPAQRKVPTHHRAQRAVLLGAGRTLWWRGAAAQASTTISSLMPALPRPSPVPAWCAACSYSAIKGRDGASGPLPCPAEVPHAPPRSAVLLRAVRTLWWRGAAAQASTTISSTLPALPRPSPVTAWCAARRFSAGPRGRRLALSICSRRCALSSRSWRCSLQ